MDFATLVSLASSSGTTMPTVASRPFITAFVLTLVGRGVYEAQRVAADMARDPLIATLADIQGMNLPMWMIGDVVLVIFGVLALIELYSESDADIRSMVQDVKTQFIAPGVGLLLNFGLVQGQAAELLLLIARILPADALDWLVQLGPSPALASVGAVGSSASVDSLGWLVTGTAALWALLMAFLTWLVAMFRQGFIDMLEQIDGDGYLGLIKLFSLTESGLAVGLIALLVFLPMIALVLTSLVLLSLFLLRKWFEWREARSKVPCGSCGVMIFPTALFCPVCRQPNDQPVEVGIFGQPKSALITDRTAHRLSLTARKRCPFCATRLTASVVRQACPACGTITFADISEANAYLRVLDKKLPVTLLICGLVGAIPVLGAAFGVLYYQLSLIGSLRAYIPGAIGCAARWGVRLATLVLLALQPFLVGWLTVPLMALLNYGVYRQVLRAQMGGLPQNQAQGGLGFGGMAVAVAGSADHFAPLAYPDPLLLSPVAAEQHMCGACGAANATGHRFCSRCGSMLDGGSTLDL